jgi:predicted ribosome-associated RNA-binding protein Tma20
MCLETDKIVHVKDWHHERLIAVGVEIAGRPSVKETDKIVHVQDRMQDEALPLQTQA